MHKTLLSLKTTAGGRSVLVLCLIAALLLAACGSPPKPEAEHEEEALARTELTDGTPIEKAEVTLITRARGGAEVMQTKARVGKVTGIYVADVAIPTKGDYDIEFHVKNAKVDERMPLTDFKVE